MRGFLLVLASASFLVSAWFLLAVLTYKVCGVGFFSPQVSWGDRLGMLLFPALPAIFGFFVLACWKAAKSSDR